MLRTIAEEGQHNDHCYLVADGQEWWITAMAGSLIFAVNESGNTIIDLSGVRWPEYTAKAIAMLAREPDMFAAGEIAP